MDQMKIDGIDFVYITSINPERDESGRIIEEIPIQQPIDSKVGFKHKYGNGPFCKFKIPTQHPVLGSLNVLGVYALIDEMGKILYVGECSSIRTSNFIKRFNYGYGQISVYKCSSRGQSTNCRINNNILAFLKEGYSVSLYFYKTPDNCCPKCIEEKILNTIPKPIWNLSIPRHHNCNIKDHNLRSKAVDPPKTRRFNRTNIKERVMDIAILYHIEPARVQGKKQVSITAREIGIRLGRTDRYPAICNALRDPTGDLQRKANVSVNNPPVKDSSTARFIYRLL